MTIAGIAARGSYPVPTPAMSEPAGFDPPIGDFASLIVAAADTRDLPDPIHADRFDARGLLQSSLPIVEATRPVAAADSIGTLPSVMRAIVSDHDPIALAPPRPAVDGVAASSLGVPESPSPAMARAVARADRAVVAGPVRFEVDEGEPTVMRRPATARVRTPAATAELAVELQQSADGLRLIARLERIETAERGRLRDAIAALLGRHGFGRHDIVIAARGQEHP